MTDSLTTSWLADFLAKAVKSNMCTHIACTTCGARPFRNELKRHASANAQRQGILSDGLTPASNIELVRQLKLLRPTDKQATQWFDPLRLIICDLEGGLMFGRIPEEQLAEQLSGTWSGSVLEKMREHAKWLATYSEEERAELLRIERRRKKQQAHQARMAQKPEIDRRWFEKHPEELANCLEIREQRAAKKANSQSESQYEQSESQT